MFRASDQKGHSRENETSPFCTQEEQKDALIALARERDEFALCIKDLRARNSWLEKQMLKTPDALR